MAQKNLETNESTARKFGARSTAREVIAGHDLRDRDAIVTGGASGIGVETVRALATAGARVVLATRDRAKGEAVAATLRNETGSAATEFVMLDSGVARVGARVRGELSRDAPSAPYPHQQRRYHGDPAGLYRGRFRVAVRDQPYRPLCARRRPDPGSQSGREGARTCASGTRRPESVKFGPKALRLAASGTITSTLDPLCDCIRA